MLFKEIENIEYDTYSTKKEIRRHIGLKTELAEEVNKVIAVVNNENKNFKINSTILFNIAIKKYFKELEKLPTDEAIKKLTNESINEVGL